MKMVNVIDRMRLFKERLMIGGTRAVFFGLVLILSRTCGIHDRSLEIPAVEEL